MPCSKKCRTKAQLASGKRSSIWKRNRWRPYSRSVQMMFPAMKHGMNLANDVVERAVRIVEGDENALKSVCARIELGQGLSAVV